MGKLDIPPKKEKQNRGRTFKKWVGTYIDEKPEICIYQGEWNNKNKLDGKGILIEKNKLTFGNWRSGKFHGKCIHIDVNGSKAEFSYKKGEKHGTCVLVNKKLDGVKEVWENGTMVNSSYIEATLLHAVELETFQGTAVQTPLRMMLEYRNIPIKDKIVSFAELEKRKKLEQ